MKTQNTTLFVLVLVVVALLTAVLVTTTVGAQPASRNLAAPAQVSYPITYQGRLTNAAGSPIASQMVNITFSLYESAGSVTAIWTQTSAVTTTAEGLFTTELLVDPPLGVSDLSNLWLGIKVGSDAEMTPRQRVGGAAFAFTLVPGNVISGTVNLADSPNSVLGLVNSGTGHGLRVSSQYGFGGYFSSAYGHALAVEGPVLFQTNLRRVALHRWYEANEAEVTYTVGMSPTGTFFDGSSVWVTNRGDDSITRLRLDGLLMGEYPVGDEPVGVTYDGARIWVANRGDNTVRRMVAANPLISSTIPVSSTPNSLCFDGRYVWAVSEGDNVVNRIEAATGAITRTLPVGQSPKTCTFDGVNVWITGYDSNNVWVRRADTGAFVRTVNVGTQPVGIIFDGANMWTANFGSGSVTKIRASDGQVLGTVSVGNGPRGITFDGFHIWVTNFLGNSVTKLRVTDGQVIGTYSLGANTNPRGITFDGSDIWIALDNVGYVIKK